MNLCIYVQTQKYTWSRFSKLMYLLSNSEVYYVQTQKYTGSTFSKSVYSLSNSEVYMKQNFNIDAFILKLRSILELDFLNYVFIFKFRSILEADFQYWCIYFETQNYTWRLSKFMYIYVQTQKNTCSRFPKQCISNSEVYFKYISFQKVKKYQLSLLKYKQITFLFLFDFILHLYFFLGSSFEAYFY